MAKHKQYPVRIPRYANGIRAQETRMGSVRSWWAREWLQRLEQMGAKGRFGRGRNYAASGQVVEMVTEDSKVLAKVVGTRPNPYAVTIDFRQLEGAAKLRVVAAIKAEPILVARLLADDLPMEIADLFRHEGYDLFPGSKLGPGKYDTTTACTCPDYANPCKHASAVLYLLGEEIACRPLTLLRLRGITIEELCDES